ncbi:ProP, Permease of the major facilitator superfamily, partial [Teratosphaeria destructans]
MPSKPTARLAAIALSFASWVAAQCPNEVAIYHPTLRTMTTNSTWFIVPVPATAAQKALDDFYGLGNAPWAMVVVCADITIQVSLAPVPTTDTTLFPSGFPSTDHPVLVSSGFDDDIRQSVLQIDGALLAGSVYVPYVRRAAPATTPSSPPPSTTTSTGQNGDAIAALVPSTVSTLIEGVLVRLAATSRRRRLPTRRRRRAQQQGRLGPPAQPPQRARRHPRRSGLPIRGRGRFTTVSAKLFKAVLNQPVILYGACSSPAECQRM